MASRKILTFAIIRLIVFFKLRRNREVMKHHARFLAACLMMLAFTDLCLSQDSPAVNMSQYLFPEFSTCTIRSTSGTVSTENGNYNTITGKMAFMKGTTIYGLAVTRQADTITFGNRHFVPFGEVFHEVVVNAPITLFIQHENRLIPPGQPVGYGGTSKVSNVDTYSHISTQSGIYSLDIPPDFEVKYMPVYRIRRDGTMHSFLGRKQFIKIFPEHKKEIGNYIKSQSIKMEDRDDLIKLVKYCNELYNK